LEGHFRYKVKELAVFFFLLPLFFSRLFIGGYGEYTDGPNLGFQFNNLESIIMVLLLIHTVVKNRKINKKAIITLSCITLSFIFIQLFYILNFHTKPITGSTKSYIIDFVLGIRYIISTAIFAFFFFDAILFKKYFILFTQISIIASFIALLGFNLLGSYVQINVQGDYGRVQGFLSEPSAFAPILAIFVIWQWKDKRYWQVMFGILCILMTKSPTCYLVIVLSITISYLIQTLRYNPVRGVVFLSLVAYLVNLLLSIDLTAGMNLYSSENPILNSVGRLFSGLEDIRTGGDTGANSRYQAYLEYKMCMENYQLYWTGYGFNSSSTFFLSYFKDGFIRDYSLYLTLLFSYGYIGVMIFYSACLYALAYLSKIQSTYYFVFISFLVASSINSAQGLVMYRMVFLGVFLALIGQKEALGGRYSLNFKSLKLNL
jgi:hypothetical protein